MYWYCSCQVQVLNQWSVWKSSGGDGTHRTCSRPTTKRGSWFCSLSCNQRNRSSSCHTTAPSLCWPGVSRERAEVHGYYVTLLHWSSQVSAYSPSGNTLSGTFRLKFELSWWTAVQMQGGCSWWTAYPSSPKTPAHQCWGSSLKYTLFFLSSYDYRTYCLGQRKPICVCFVFSVSSMQWTSWK